jgi:hypothetical protein
MLASNDYQSRRRREDPMTRTRGFARRIGLTAICIGVLLWAPRLVWAQSPTTDVAQQAVTVQSHGIAEQLGTKLSPQQREELTLGVTLNGSLQEPAKLARFGITGVHRGARVTAMRISSEKLVLEVDELEPAPTTKRATLRIDGRGRLSAP